MKKRAVTVFFLLSSFFACLAFRAADIASDIQTATVSGSGIRFDVAELRGTVYDCNLQPLTNGETLYKAVAKPTQKAMAALEKELGVSEFLHVKEKMLAGEAVCVDVSSDSCNGQDICVVEYPGRYGSYACHLIGYCGFDGNGVSGAEKAFNDQLESGSVTVTARIDADANGRVLLGEKIEIQNSVFPVQGEVITVDRDIQKTVEDALDSSGVRCAAAVVTDVETGAIKACVSRPSFSQYDLASALDDPDSPLINRAFLPFSVGSVFKTVVSAAALENGVKSDFSYECTGGVTLNGVTFNCHKKDGHGVLDMKGAVANSCNTYFIALALETGAQNIIKTAEKFGFGKETLLAEGIKSRSGNLPDGTDSDAATANLSFGQGELTATPLQICAMMAAVANGGCYVEPYLVEGEVDADGVFVKKYNYSERKQIISDVTAEQLQSFLEAVVEQGSGRCIFREGFQLHLQFGIGLGGLYHERTDAVVIHGTGFLCHQYDVRGVRQLVGGA